MSGYRPLKALPQVLGLNVSGRIYATPGTVGTVNMGNNTLRATPIWLPEPIVIDQLSVEVTVAGQAESTIRLGVYKLQPNGLVRLVDAGSVSGATTGFKSLSVDLAIPAGIVAFAAAVQNAPTTRPTLRAVTSANQWVHRTSLNEQTAAFATTNITGGLPHTREMGSTDAGVRVYWRIA